MIKLLALLALCAGVLLGASAARRLKKQEDFLRETRQFLLSLKLGLEYASAPLPVLLQSVSDADSPRAFPFSGSVLRLLGEGKTLPEAWQTAAAQAAKKFGAPTLAPLAHLGGLLGATDKQGQLELLTRELFETDALMKCAKQKYERCATLYRAAGAFAGFAVCILMI